VKLEVDALATVPDAPPAAGPDRALEPPRAAVAGGLLAGVVAGEVADEEDVPQAASPITPHITAAAGIHRLLLGLRLDLFTMTSSWCE
jgi:hypothetical protein